MGKRSKNMRDRLLVGILSLAMLLTGVTMPTGTAKAADVTIDLLNGSSITKTGTVTKDEYGDDLFCEEQFAELGSELLNNGASGYSSLKFEATVKVNSCSKGTPTIVLYAMNKSYGGWKDAGKEAAIGTAQTVSLDLKSFSSFSRVGIRFTQCEAGTKINYTISSAKIIGTKSSGTGSGSSGTVEGERIEGVSASVNYLSANSNQYYSEYNLTVKNDSSSPASNFLIKIPVSGNTKDLALQAHGSLGGTPRYSDGYIIIRFTQTVAAGGTFSSGDGKFGFGEGTNVVLGTPVVVKDDGSFTSASQLKYELTGQTKNVAYADTPFGKHGKLELKEMSGYSAPIIVDQNGKPFQLRGASTHGMHWNEMHPYVNKDAFQSLRDEWGVNMVRLVSYITQGGYTEGSQALLDSKIQEGVKAATDLGMYVLIDWHVHAENPHTKKDWAEKFFQKYASMYKDYDNVLFEICNEPTGVEWYNGSGGDLYSYCKNIAGIIRKADSDALIICGTNTWSQDVDDVAKKPLKNDGFKNILYTFHFYAATHYEDKMNKVRTAIAAGTPIFVTEFGICSADGNGNFDTGNADAWIELCDKNNISYACWSLCNKNEAASYLLPSSNKLSGWTEEDLATTGIWLVNTYRAHQDKEDGTDTGKGEATPKPSSSATPDPDATVDPSATPDPDATVDPSATPDPDATVDPSATPGPSETPDPNSSAKPSKTLEPGSSATPNTTSQPGSSSNPGGANPSQTPGIDNPWASWRPGGNDPLTTQTPGGDDPFQTQTPGGDPGASTAPGSTNPPGSTNDPYASQSPQASTAPGIGNTDVITDPNIAISNKWSGADARLAEQIIVSQKSDKDIAGSAFGALKLRVTKTTKNSVKLKWNTVAGASKYIVYGNRCGNNNTLQKLATVTGTSWTHKSLKKGTYYKYLVVACRTEGRDGVKCLFNVTLGISKTVHATTLGGKKGNVKKVTVKKAKVTLKKGKSFKIKAKQVPLKKKNKIANHRKISYESSNPAIATVSSSGKIKAKKKGKCNIYVYAQNGIYKQVKVTVK